MPLPLPSILNQIEELTIINRPSHENDDHDHEEAK
jgi:hypothetical protein